MSDETDYSSLPLDERLVHKVWKVRLGAYEELSTQFENSRSGKDVCFEVYNNRPELLKTFISDSNVVAQEQAIKVLQKYLEFGGTPSNVTRLKNASVIKVLCEKTLSSSRKNTKDYAIECLMLMIENANDVSGIIEDIIPSLTHRLPKLVAGCTSALYIIVENFGCKVIPPNAIVPSLAKLFAHADRSVRAEATKLTVELYIWMKDSLETVLFSELKPVQQKDLRALFESKKDEKPEQKRYTVAQQEEISRRKEIESAKHAQVEDENADGDIEMRDVDENENGELDFDPYEIAEPVDVLLKIPGDFNSRLSSAKWKDRKEALDDVFAILEKTVKIVPGDYTSLVKNFAKCMKDANIQVVQLAANCTEFLIRGLRSGFFKYINIILGPMIERTKEKKASVATALSNALDAIFAISSLSDILDEIISGMSSKIPQIKIASTNYLQRCLMETKEPPSTNEIDSIMAIGVKLLADSQEPVRQASTEMIGTLMKIVGERELAGFIEKIDENRKSKVRSFFETVAVKCKNTKATPKQTTRAPVRENNMSNNSQYGRKVSTSSTLKKSRPELSTTTIPAKRGATSPVKRIEETSKVPAFGRGLTGRSLMSNTSTLSHPEPQMNQSKADYSISNDELEELIKLRSEKEIWHEEKKKHSMLQLQFSDQKLLLNQEISQLKDRNEESAREYNNAMLMLKQKDTQILRLNSDLENAKLKIRDLEQTIEMMKLQQNQLQAKQSYSSFYSPTSNGIEGTKSPPKTELRSGINSGELSSRVKRLSIEGEPYIETTASPYLSIRTNNRFESPQRISSNTISPGRVFGNEKADIDSNEDSWRRAAEVTSQLKARIEKMKARARSGY